jgi:hypothetical protein
MKAVGSGTAGVMLKAFELAQMQLDSYKQLSASWAPQPKSGAVRAKKAGSESHKAQQRAKHL